MAPKWVKPECIICGVTENLTRDHVLPKWFSLGIVYFGFRLRPSNMDKSKFTAYKYQTLCEKCNVQKSGIIDYNNGRVREYLKLFAQNLLDIIKIHEGVNNSS